MVDRELFAALFGLGNQIEGNLNGAVDKGVKPPDWLLDEGIVTLNESFYAIFEDHLIWAAQTGKTIVLQCFLGWAIDQYPGPGMVVCPDGPFAKRRSTKHLRPFVEDSEVLSTHLPGDRHEISGHSRPSAFPVPSSTNGHSPGIFYSRIELPRPLVEGSADSCLLPHRGSVSQPRVGAPRLPWVAAGLSINPKRGCVVLRG